MSIRKAVKNLGRYKELLQRVASGEYIKRFVYVTNRKKLALETTELLRGLRIGETWYAPFPQRYQHGLPNFFKVEAALQQFSFEASFR